MKITKYLSYYAKYLIFKLFILDIIYFILDAVREISNMWKTYDEAIKNKMNEEFKHELEIYKQNNLAYKENLTDLQKFEVMRVKYEEMEQKTKRKLKKVLQIFRSN